MPNIRHKSEKVNSWLDDKPLIEGTGELLVDKSATGRERPWKEMKTLNDKLVAIATATSDADEEIFNPNQLARLIDCGQILDFARLHDNQIKLARANFCRNRLCPMCNWRRSLKLFSQVSQIIDYANNHYQHISYLFVTLTIKNCTKDNFKETIDKLNKAFKKLVGHKLNKKLNSRPNSFQENQIGYLKATEVTYNREEDSYHPHLHCIFAIKNGFFKGGNYWKMNRWREEWQKCLGIDYTPQVDVKKIYNSTPQGIAEVAKYPMKIASIFSIPERDKQREVLKTLKDGTFGRQFITYGGIFKEIKKILELDDIEEGDLVNTGDDETIKAEVKEIVRFTWRAGLYVC